MGWSGPGSLWGSAAGYVIAIICAIAGAYQLIALVASLLHRHRRGEACLAVCTPVSVLKPVHGEYPGFVKALSSHTTQDYPEFELLLGHQDRNDPAIANVAHKRVRTILCTTKTPNGKVGTLMDLAKAARYPIMIVNDADIAVPENYIRDVTAPLSDPSIGMVTCIYRAEGDSWPSRWEALGVATDFAPSTLVAPFVGVSEFGLGSTLAFRRADLERIGGFAAVAGYLADDYQLGRKLHALGLRNVISPVVVSTRLHAQSWSAVWRHQLRWARTIRLSRKGGYLGLPVTFATVWAITAACAGLWWAAIGLLAIRLVMAVTAGWLVLRSRDVLKLWFLIPLRDVYGAAVWAVALVGNTVEWGGETLKLDSHGRILR